MRGHIHTVKSSINVVADVIVSYACGGLRYIFFHRIHTISPIVLMNDPRITTPFPNFHGSEALWPKLMKAQEAMLKTGIMAKEMTAGGIKGSPESIRERVCELDSFILTIINELDHPPEIRPPEELPVDAASILNLWLMARFLAHTARIKLHRFRAFADHPVFLDKFCDLSSINSLISSDLPFAISPGRFSESNSVFPFTEEQSTQICLKAALVLSRTLSALPWPYPSFSDTVGGAKKFSTTGQLSMSSIFSTNRIQYPRSLPYMACCGMQGCYVLMMLLRKIRNALSSNNLAPCRYLLGYTEPATERQDAERFIEELRHGVKSVCDFMLGNAVFGGVMDMAREVETTYIANFHE
ncbi:Zn(II)2Cys6 transcription factor [Penicillium herquei]|nr:Zn(II)2Cys6 transcription factor [Penicillium herquei]